MKHSSFKDWILVENDDYIIINKPPFVSTLTDRHEKIDILSQAKKYISTAQVGHRLDKETSGVLAIAKNEDAYRELAIQFEKREVTKFYHALVEGNHRFENTKVDLPITTLNKGTVRIDGSGKPAESYFTSMQGFNRYTLVLCQPITGRMHQLRIHLATLGAPIAGDTSYGGKPIFLSSIKKKFNLKKNTEEQPLMKRVALHAFSLRFKLRDGKDLFVEAPYPKDFEALLHQLEKNTKKS